MSFRGSCRGILSLGSLTRSLTYVRDDSLIKLSRLLIARIKRLAINNLVNDTKGFGIFG
jgi:hypothetical protein